MILKDNRGVTLPRLGVWRGSKRSVKTNPANALATLLNVFSPVIAFQAPIANVRRRPLAFRRHEPPVARELAFVAKAEVSSPPFSPGSKPIGDFLAKDSSLRILMSQADSSERLDRCESKEEQRWEVSTRIPFPGMLARTATPMNIKIDSTTPLLQVSSSESRTVCEGGPGWARAALERIGDIASTTSTNKVELRDAPGGKKFVSTVMLKVSLDIPPLFMFLPMPVGVFESAGSDSIQEILDRDMPVTLKKLQEAYVKWSAEGDGD